MKNTAHFVVFLCQNNGNVYISWKCNHLKNKLQIFVLKPMKVLSILQSFQNPSHLLNPFILVGPNIYFIVLVSALKPWGASNCLKFDLFSFHPSLYQLSTQPGYFIFSCSCSDNLLCTWMSLTSSRWVKSTQLQLPFSLPPLQIPAALPLLIILAALTKAYLFSTY